jgi:hypothetical protein
MIRPPPRSTQPCTLLPYTTLFRSFLCSSAGVSHCTHSNGICHTGLLTAWQRAASEQNWFRPDPARCQAVSKRVWHIPLLCVQWKTPDGGQTNCLKHVEFYSKNKFEKLMHLVSFIIRIHHDARSSERQIRIPSWSCSLSSCQQTCMIYTIAVCTVRNSCWWTEELSETV